MYVGGTIFVDVASHTIHVYHQVSLAAADTLLSKAQFEQDAASYGVSIKQYHVDNGIFTSAAWKDNLHGERHQQQSRRLRIPPAMSQGQHPAAPPPNRQRPAPIDTTFAQPRTPAATAPPTFDFSDQGEHVNPPTPRALAPPPSPRAPPTPHLTKSLYGHKHAAKLFYQLLRDTLTKKLNFHLSPSDHCLFIRHDCIIINWVDDQLILTKDPMVALEVVESMRSAGLILDIESQQGSIANYLGIQIQEQDDGTLLLTQSGLVERVLEAIDLKDANPKDTPASEALGSNKDSPTFDGKYNYRSVIGMIMYLTSSTRPDCAFAIHQCAHFSHDPRQAHASALKRLACYLKKTKLDGLRIKPHCFGNPARLDLWVDADFAGIWGKDDPQDPSMVRSHSGILVTYDDTSVFWSSKLQTEIALSTMEAEYIALSAGMRILIHLRRIHEDVCTHFKGCEIPYDPQSNISHVFEDNHACFVLATTDPPRMTPRSKTIAIKYHWFREHLKEGEIEMRTTKSEDQRANIPTKALPRPQFETERHLIMGF
jgi:hypothetical protein